MKIFEAPVSLLIADFFKENLSNETSLTVVNGLLKSVSGINEFFETVDDFNNFKGKLLHSQDIVQEPDRAEYGDFQTNPGLALAVVQHLLKQTDRSEILIEPTCGKGTFVLASLQTFRSLKKVYGIEIYKPYVWETKFSILDFFLRNPSANKPEINILHCNVFDFDFDSIASAHSQNNILIVGNPPWVTNAMLGSLNSSNLPAKTNFKKHSGLDAMTGKGNFDIAEYITLLLLNSFQNTNGMLALLVKNSVIKNIVFDQKKNNYRIGNLQKHRIDSKVEFNVSVDASVFLCRLNATPAYNCQEFDFYQNDSPCLRFGWSDDKFVSNIEKYAQTNQIDGVSPFEWRQGMKHDCSSIMEMEKLNGHYVNALQEEIDLESDLVYGLLKSSDLKNTLVKSVRKYTIVTQRRIGEDTSFIRRDYPRTYQYLSNHKSLFEARKSSIYRGKPPFSIFGIGDYSFAPYKVVISGLYKTFHFTLVLPENKKPIMLDDTCYMLGFDNLDYAVYTLILLNSKITTEFLQAITFPDAKRTFTKDVLQRIDLYKLSKHITIEDLKAEIKAFNKTYDLHLDTDANNWKLYLNQIKPVVNTQVEMFA
jgi:hypothetical protein